MTAAEIGSAREAVPWTTADEHAEEIIEELDEPLSESARETAITLATKYDGETCKAPSSIAAASVYLAGLLENEQRTQKEIGEVADRSPVSIRESFHLLAEREGYDLPDRDGESGGNGYSPDAQPNSKLAWAILQRVPGWSA